MKINRLSLLYSLFAIINENDEGDKDYILAKYFLENYKHIGEMNIYDVASDCYVSRSSVRRFCQRIGYENFVDLKSGFSEYDDHYAFYMTHANRENYRTVLTQEINQMIQELDVRMNTTEVDRIIRLMHDSTNVVFLVSESSTMPVKDFQKAMIFHQKLVYVITDAYTDSSLVKRLKPQDYLITLSPTGTLALAAQGYLSECKAVKALFTYNRDPNLQNGYDKTYHLSAQDRTSEGNSVYGKYGIAYILDVIYSAYVKKYGIIH